MNTEPEQFTNDEQFDTAAIATQPQEEEERWTHKDLTQLRKNINKLKTRDQMQRLKQAESFSIASVFPSLKKP